MTTTCAVIDYKSDKNCFLTLPEGLIPHDVSDQIVVYELQEDGKEVVFCSWSGETTHSQNDGSKTILLNGLYANKLGIVHGSAVVMKRVPSLPECVSVFVEPVSVDDWEILEIHSQYVESHLLDQVRVIWDGQVLPVWVNSSICVFLKIGKIKPPAKCVLLVNNTEVIVDPKVRSVGQGKGQDHTKVTSQLSTSTNSQSGFNAMKEEQMTQIDQSNYRRLSSNQKTNSVSSTGMVQGITKYMKSFLWSSETVKSSAELSSVSKQDDTAVLSKSFKCGLRVQPLRVCEDEAELEFSTNVFVRHSDVAPKYIGPGNATANKLPAVFYARLSKILSPEEKEEQKKTAELKETEKTKGGPVNSSSNSTLKSTTKANPIKDLCAIVRIVAIETPGLCLDMGYHSIVREVLQQQPILEGHMIVSDFLRRQLKLGVTGRVQLEGLSSSPADVNAILVFQISDLPHSITSHMITTAFRSWLDRTLTDNKSMVIFQQMLVKFPILPELYLEALITFDPVNANQSETRTQDYAVIHWSQCQSLSIIVRERVNGRRNWPEISHYPCSNVSEFDPVVPTVLLENLGGLDELVPKALSHIELCFGQRPLTHAVFPSLIGLHTGVLLVTGDRGTGKSALVKALCRRVAQLPCLAYTTVVECKALKGKRPETIQRLLEKTFDESSWRQPSVIVLDDVDVLAGVSNDPDAERTGEAQYSYKLSEVIRNIIKTELINNPKLAVIFTSRSRSSVHPSLVSARGLHIVQEVVEIKPPTKIGKKEILEAILRSKTSVKPECITSLPLQDLSSRMEGFVAQDLRAVVDRAIHAHHMADSSPDVSLCEEDFEAALEDFVPASLRNVTLHQETDIGWADIGGLEDVKNTLIETLEWPTKYPQLFANCPLRLRSGLLLFGAPGTGKTLLARAVAKECGLNFISIKGPELLSKYIGASEQAVRDTFARAQSARPCILFFDEFDSIAPRRGHDSTGVTDRVVNQLLTQLDGVEGLEGVYVLGATSRPDLIDPALLRPGRLDKCLHCELPTAEERLEILSTLSKKLNVNEDVDFRVVSNSCENFTGADFKALLYNAQLEAIHEMTSVVKGRNPSSPMEDLEQRTEMVCKSVTSVQKSLTESRQRTLAGEESCVLSVGGSRVTYIPKLEEGPVKLEPEVEKQFMNQINQLAIRLKKQSHYRSTTGSIGDISPTESNQSNSMIQVNQSHLLRAAKEVRPSVSAEERMKYEIIYSNFVKSRGGDFNSGTLPLGKRLTLA